MPRINTLFFLFSDFSICMIFFFFCSFTWGSLASLLKVSHHYRSPNISQSKNYVEMKGLVLILIQEI